jgi:hypothetical protein
MAERWNRLRWALLAVALVVLVVFLVAQRQSVDVSYAESPSGRDTVAEGSAGELSDATLPSVEEMTARLDARPVVRLPGAVAAWDEQRLRTAIGDEDVRILVAPPGLTEKQQDQVNDVENADILVIGTQVTGTGLQSVGDDVTSWRAQFATADITGQLLSLVAAIRHRPQPSDVDLFTRRAPTAAELAAVTADLRAGRPHLAPGATLETVPDAARDAFPDGVLVAALPRQTFGKPVPDYGPALAKTFPDKPIVVMYGYWIEYHGPQARDFADVATAAFYARFGDRVSRFAYPQGNVLGAYLNTVTDVRYAGLFDRPLPYAPFDPLRVALPVLPWLFAACVLGFLVLSARSLRGPGRFPHAPPARLAGLTTLAIELSGLSHDAALTRGLGKLRAAREAIGEDLPDQHVRRLLGEAEKELDQAARALGRPDYRPATYLAGGVS